MLEDSFIVTSLHHRPWGAGDDIATIGVFFTEREAKDAAYVHFRGIKRGVDGWESEWRRLTGDGMLQLYGYIEEGEEDSETYKASIKPYQLKRPVAVQPSVRTTPRPEPRVSRRRYVYMVKEEQRFNAEADDWRELYNGSKDLKDKHIHGIYAKLDTANDCAREIYDTIP